MLNPIEIILEIYYKFGDTFSMRTYSSKINFKNMQEAIFLFEMLHLGMKCACFVLYVTNSENVKY
jgi:hypothetical protein